MIEAVESLELQPFYCDYRADGPGRPAHDPQMMVALVLYAYATGVRSSRAIERHLIDDVAFRVIAAGQAPDHATIARFRRRHRDALAGLFSAVLALCAKAGLVRAGTLALDSTKLHANASGQANMTYEQLAQAILDEAAEIDARDDELYGERRGDELPEHLSTKRKRREWLEQARRELQAEQAARPKPSARAERLGEAKRRLEDEHALERQATLAYEAGRAERERELAEQGRRLPGRPRTEALVVPDKPAGRVNLTDPDSRPVKTPRGFIQGYNAQAGTDVLVPPDGHARRGPPLKTHALAAEMRARLATDAGRALYRKRQQIIEPVFGQTNANRRAERFLCRGLAACRAEWRLTMATHNLLKLWRHGLVAAAA